MLIMSIQQKGKIKEWKKESQREINEFFQAQILDFKHEPEYFYCRWDHQPEILWKNKVIKQLSRKDIIHLCDTGRIYLEKNYL